MAGIASLALSNVPRVEWLEEERLRLDAAHDRNLIGESSRMREIGYLIARVDPADSERREDVPLLASHFAALVGRKLGRPVLGFTPEARTCLLHYDWPGNVRELANAVERAVVLGDGELIRAEDLPETVLEAMPAAGRTPVTHYHTTLNETKKRLILGAIEQAGGSVTKAAELLGLNANYLHRLISTLGLREQ